MKNPIRRVRLPILPVVATGLAIVLPWRALELAQQWRALAAEPPRQSIASASVAPAQTAHPAGDSAAVPAAVPPDCRPLASSSGDQVDDAALMTEVARRNAELDSREHALRMREVQLAAASKLAAAQMAELERLRQSVQGLIVRESTASEQDITLLVGLYSNMKPAQAATVLSKLDASKAAEILQHLETRQAGPILAAMDSAAAVKVTEELEQRHSAFRP